MKLLISLLPFVAAVAANPLFKMPARSDAAVDARAGPVSCLGFKICAGGIDELASCEAQGYVCEHHGNGTVPFQLGPGGTPNGASCQNGVIRSAEVSVPKAGIASRPPLLQHPNHIQPMPRDADELNGGCLELGPILFHNKTPIHPEP
ncbi:hypothetical protein DFH09DRAFT_1069051 [Mycena vulgaris]|nr:hypothetical protein DFH09DRAFT_1069051 [Mycena vulgaris]